MYTAFDPPTPCTALLDKANVLAGDPAESVTYTESAWLYINAFTGLLGTGCANVVVCDIFAAAAWAVACA